MGCNTSQVLATPEAETLSMLPGDETKETTPWEQPRSSMPASPAGDSMASKVASQRLDPLEEQPEFRAQSSTRDLQLAVRQKEPSQAITVAKEETLQPEFSELQSLFDNCWVVADSGDDALSSIESTKAAMEKHGSLSVEAVMINRPLIANFCFGQTPTLMRKALGYLRRLLDNSPVGHPDLACGLISLVDQFIDTVPVEKWSNITLDLTTKMLQCLVSLLESVRAEHLIGNLPAIPKSWREKVWSYADDLKELNVRTSGGSKPTDVVEEGRALLPDGLIDECADLLTDLWLNTLVQVAMKLKTPETKLQEGAEMLAGTAGAALKLYNGDISAGLTQLKSTFRHSTINMDAWYDEVVVLRKLVSDAVKDEYVFRQLKWSISGGSVAGPPAPNQTPRFLMHVVLCLERLVVEGHSGFIREQSLQLLTFYATASNPKLQYTACKGLENLAEIDTSEEIRSTARVVLEIVNRALLSESEDRRLKDYAARLGARFVEIRRQQREKAFLREACVGGEGRDEFQGHSSVIAYLINHLNEGSGDIASEETIMSMASKVTSQHAARVTEVVRDVVYLGSTSSAYFQKKNKDGLTPVHEAARTGIVANLAWMIQAAAGEDVCMATLEADTGAQPIHYAGSVEVLDLLLANRASLTARDHEKNTILHTLAHATVLREVLRRFEHAEEKDRIDINTRNVSDQPPLFVSNAERGADVIDVILSYGVDLNMKGGPRINDMNALMAAAQSDQVEVCRFLLTKRIDVRAKTSSNQNVLHFAGRNSIYCLLDHPEIQTLCNEPDQFGYTPLHSASDIQVATELVAQLADVNAKNRYGLTPLLTCSGLELMSLLLRSGADPLVINHMGDPLFIDKIWSQDAMSVWVMLQDEKVKADMIELRGKDGRNCILNNFGKLPILQVLHSLGVPLTAFNARFDESSMTNGGGLAYYTFMIENHVDPNLRTPLTGRTAIHNEMAHECSVSVLEQMIRMKCDPTLRTSLNESSIELAFEKPWHSENRDFQKKQKLLMSFLLQKGVSIEESDPLIWKWSHNDPSCPQFDALEALLDKKCGVNVLSRAWTESPLHVAVTKWWPPEGEGVLETLLVKKADPRRPNIKGMTVFHFALHSTRPKEIIQRMLKVCPETANVMDLAGDTPEELARRKGWDDVAELLRNATKLSPQQDGAALARQQLSSTQNPFTLARLGLVEETKSSITSENIAKLRCPGTGGTILHAAVGGGSLDLVQFILSVAPELIVEKGSLQRSPLHYLTQSDVQPKEAEAIARALIAAKADVGEDVGILQKTGLILVSAQSNSMGVGKVLLEGEADPNAKCGSAFPLAIAASADMVELLLQFKATMECEGIAGNALTARAGDKSACGAFRALLRAASPEDLEKNTDDGETALILAAQSAPRNLQALLDAKANIGATDKSGKTALHYISNYSNIWELKNEALRTFESRNKQLDPQFMPGVKLLLNARMDINQLDSHEVSPLYNILESLSFCTDQEADQLMRLLNSHKADFSYRPVDGDPVAFKCVGSLTALKYLLDEIQAVPITLQATESKENFAHSAVKCDHRGVGVVLKYLERKFQDAKLKFWSSDNPGKHTLLHDAATTCTNGAHNLSYVLEQLDKEPEAFSTLAFAQTKKKETVIHILARHPPYKGQGAFGLSLYLDIASRILGDDVQRLVNIRDSQKAAPIDGQVDIDVINVLLQAKADPRTALSTMDYHRMKRLDVVDLLLSMDADINHLPAEDSEISEAPLHRIIQTGDAWLAKQWIKRGARIDIRDHKGNSLVYYAQLPHTLSMCKEMGLDINAQSSLTGDTLLHSLAGDGQSAMVEYLLKNLKAKSSLNSQGETVTHIAAKKGHIGTLKVLLDQGFDLMEADREGQAPLHAACKARSVAAAKLLLEEFADVNQDDELGETPLLEASRQGSVEVFDLLIKHRASISAKTKDGQTVLHFAAAFNRTGLLRRLLSESEFDVNAQTKGTCCTALHKAVERDNEGAVQLLVEDSRVGHTLTNKIGLTPLSLAARGKHNLVKLLVEKRNVEVEMLQQPMLEAVRTENLNICKYLLGKSVSLSQCIDSDGSNVLHLVARTGSDEIAQLLLEAWSDDEALQTALAAKNSQGYTPPVEAIMKEHDRVQRCFILTYRKKNMPRPRFMVHRTDTTLRVDAVEVEASNTHRSWICCSSPRKA